MKYPCYQLAQGRQVIANFKAQGKLLRSIPQPENRTVVAASSEVEFDEILRLLSKQISVAEAEKLHATGLSDDQVEGHFAVILHSEFSDFPAQALTDPDFWRYVSAEFFRDFIYWRDGENCSPASFGLDAKRRIPNCVPLRMFNRAHIANRIIENGSSLDLGKICLAAGADFWQSFIETYCLFMFCRRNMIIVATFLARTIVTFFAIILEAERGQIFIAKHCYILAI